MQIFFTKEGFEDLKKKTESLVRERPIAVLDLKKAREMGDLSENGYYKAAKFKLNDIDRSIRRNNYLIKYAKICVPTDNYKICIGHKVKLEVNGDKKEYQIVGEYEANPSEGKISYLSPVGKELMGKSENENMKMNINNKEVFYKVLKISS